MAKNKSNEKEMRIIPLPANFDPDMIRKFIEDQMTADNDDEYLSNEPAEIALTEKNMDFINSSAIATEIWEMQYCFSEDYYGDSLSILNIKYNMKELLRRLNRYNSREVDLVKSYKRCDWFCLSHDGISTTYKFITDLGVENVIAFSAQTMQALDFIARRRAYEYHGRKRYNSVTQEAVYGLTCECIDRINHGHGNEPMPCPVEKFCIALKKGEYNHLSEAEYSAELANQKNIARLFNGKPAELANIVLSNIIVNSSLNTDDIRAIGDKISKRMENNICISDGINKPDEDVMSKYMNLSPKEIYDLIDKNVVHQENAKKVAAMLMYNHIHGHGRNIIMAGPTGCGKTEIWRTLSETFPFIEMINGPQLSPESYKGDYKISEIFTKYKREPNKAQHLILVIDEADKIFEPQISSGGSDFAKLLQNELLKIMDHGSNSKVTFVSEGRQEPSVNMIIDCQGISVVLCGSFEKLLKTKENEPSPIGFILDKDTEPCLENVVENCAEKDFIDYANMRTELVGRINTIATLKGMTTEDFEYIIDHKTASPIKKIENELGIKLNISKSAKNQLAKHAVDTKLGCRIIRSTILRHLDNEMFEDPTKEKYNLSKQILNELK